MQYISPKGEYPRYYGDIMNAHAGWQLGDELPDGWQEVASADIPLVAEYEIFYEGEPALVDGILTQNWLIRPMTSEEIERKDAPKTAKQKLVALGLSELEIQALSNGMVG